MVRKGSTVAALPAFNGKSSGRDAIASSVELALSFEHQLVCHTEHSFPGRIKKAIDLRFTAWYISSLAISTCQGSYPPPRK